MATALVIEQDPTDDIRRLGDWLTDAGLELTVLRPYAGDGMPAELDGHSALLVLGVDQPDAADPGWAGGLESLLRRAVRARVPTLAVGAGAQALAAAHGGVVEAGTPELGPGLVGRRDAADHDPVFAPVPFAPDVLQWHRREITELPVTAVPMAASPRSAYEAFRIGERAWGLRFHIECDLAMIATWVDADADTLAGLGRDPGRLLEVCGSLQGEWEDTWQPFAWRFAALARGDLPEPLARRAGAQPGEHRHLPLLGQ